MNDISAADTTGPAALYRARCDAGAIRPDPEQERVAARLDRLYRDMRQPAARPALREWAAARPLSAVRCAARRAARHRGARQRPRLPAGADAWSAGVSLAAR